jgi:D-alanyl-D-alanine dipeptidase
LPDQAMKAGYYRRDFGTNFDFFDEASATDHPGIGAEPKQNRATMQRHGFVNFGHKLWHFALKEVTRCRAARF